jgi:hypothetical protein
LSTAYALIFKDIDAVNIELPHLDDSANIIFNSGNSLSSICGSQTITLSENGVSPPAYISSQTTDAGGIFSVGVATED